MKNNIIKYFLAMVIALLFVFGCVFAQVIFAEEKTNDISEKNTMEKDFYNGYGLENGTALSDKIIYESDSYICYEDRILRKPKYENESINNVAAILDGILARCPSIENIYVLPVPNRIVFESGYEDEMNAYNRYLEQMMAALPQKTMLVNVLTSLGEHIDEYIFFRTEDSWTAKGAGYGMKSLCDAMGLNYIGLSQYEEYMYTNFRGSLPKNKELSDMPDNTFPEDKLYYYLIYGSIDDIELFEENQDGNIISYKKPLITPSSGNTGAFINGNYVRAIVEGETGEEKNKDKKLLLICDENGKLLVPYLKDYYDGVYVINVREDNDFYNDINKIVAENNITEVVYAQNVSEMGTPGHFRALGDFCEKE